MAREPQIAADDYDALIGLLEDEGYDITKIRKVPQSW